MAATSAMPVAATTTTNGIARVVQNVQLPALTPEQQEALNKAKQYAVQESVKHVLVKQQQAQAKLAMENAGVAAQQLQQIGGVPSASENQFLQKQQALVLMCRVYVGSIYYDLKEEVIKNAFSPFGPFKSINMSLDPITGKHKGYAFIEYECPEAAQLALEQMGGVMMGGRNLKVGRPLNMPQTHPVIDLLLEESKQVKRIYVSAIHSDITCEDLKSVFSAFGTILSCDLAMDVINSKHKGYGFIEYDTLQSANDAVGSMNLFHLGGQHLRVGKAIAPAGVAIPAGSSFNNNFGGSNPGFGSTLPYTNNFHNTFPNLNRFQPPPTLIPPTPIIQPNMMIRPPQIPPPGIAIPSPLTNRNRDLPNTLRTQEDVKLSGTDSRPMMMHKLIRKVESRVLILRNMVGIEDVDEDLESEVTEECGKFGTVNRVIIYQEKQGEEEDAVVVVKIFVEFDQVESCARACEAMNGRWFGGRQIQAAAYSQLKFDDNDLRD